jgi:potassium channel subfamily K
MNVAKGSPKEAQTMGKGTDKAVRGSLEKTVAAMRGQTVKDASIYDEEAATENQSLLQDENKRNDLPPRKGTALWAKLLERQESIVFHATPSFHSMESMERRKTLHEHEMKQEIRSRLDLSLTHCLVAIFAYLGVAVLAYSLVFEKWPIVDSIYFATVTFTTIGYGDLAPTSDASRLFTAFFALAGIAAFGIALGVLGSNLIEAQTHAMDRASEMSIHQVMSLFDSPQTELEVEAKQPPWYRSALVRDALPVCSLLFLYCCLVWFRSDWDAVSAFYYCITTAATIGFGDLSPQTQSERLLAVPFILLAVSAMGQWLRVAANVIIHRRQQEFLKRFETHELTLNDLLVMDDDGDGKVTLAEYFAFMLVAMNKVDQELMDALTTQFNRLDVDGTGCLEKEDLIIVAKRKLQSSRRKLQLCKYKQELLEKCGRGDRHGGSRFGSIEEMCRTNANDG